MTDATPAPLADGGDPNDFTNDEVNDYLAGADDTERDRVLAAERAGQARVGILGKADANGNRPTDSDGAYAGTDTPAVQTSPQGLAEAAAAVGGETVDVVLRQHWNDADGKAHKPGDTVTVDAQTAVTLLGARWADRAEG